jgi:hypothetical protein
MPFTESFVPDTGRHDRAPDAARRAHAAGAHAAGAAAGLPATDGAARADEAALGGLAYPSTQTYRPAVTPAQRIAVEDFLNTREDEGRALRPRLTVLCIAWWLEQHAGRSAVCTADVRALYPARAGRAIPSAATLSRVLADGRTHGLFEALGGGWYRVTRLGGTVVDTLPDLFPLPGVFGARSTTRLRP